MIPKSFGLLFYRKKHPVPTKVNRPIYLRITVDGVLKEMSIKRSWDPARWNSKIGRAIVSKLTGSPISQLPSKPANAPTL